MSDDKNKTLFAKRKYDSDDKDPSRSLLSQSTSLLR